MLRLMSAVPEMSDIIITVLAARRRQLEAGDGMLVLIGEESDRAIRRVADTLATSMSHYLSSRLEADPAVTIDYGARVTELHRGEVLEAVAIQNANGEHSSSRVMGHRPPYRLPPIHGIGEKNASEEQSCEPDPARTRIAEVDKREHQAGDEDATRQPNSACAIISTATTEASAQIGRRLSDE